MHLVVERHLRAQSLVSGLLQKHSFCDRWVWGRGIAKITAGFTIEGRSLTVAFRQEGPEAAKKGALRASERNSKGSTECDLKVETLNGQP